MVGRVSTTDQDRLEPWVFAPETKLIPEDEYIDLEVIDLSDFRTFESSQPLSAELQSKQDDLITRTLHALRTVGFLALKGHGVSEEEWQHQFNLGKLLNERVSESEKHALHADITQGSWAGYKPQGYYKRPNGTVDSLEHYDFYPFTLRESRLPEIGKPYLPDFRQFVEFNHYTILRKILGVISLGLGLEVDTLWRLHHRGGEDDGRPLNVGSDDEIKWPHSKDHLRYAVYHPPPEADREKRAHLWLPGHTDLGSVTFLYSQPIAGLQTLTPDGKWRYIRHYPNHIIISLGDCMEFLTGGILKAAPHRVKEPPDDQRHFDRLGIFYFAPFHGDVLLSPLDYPSLHALGMKDYFEEYYRLGGKPMRSGEWLVEKSKLVGTKRVKREKKDPRDMLEDIHFRYNPN